MKWSSAVSESPTLAQAVKECATAITGELGGQPAHLVVAFPSAHHSADYGAVPDLVREHLGDGLLIGCSGGGVIGAGREVENRPGFAMTAAHLLDVELVPFHVESPDLPDDDAPPNEWENIVGTSAQNKPDFVLLADPFSFDPANLLAGLDYAFPMSAKIGGIASGGQQPGGNALYLSDTVHRSGVVGVAAHGAIAVDTIVAQGCRPIGEPMQITSCSKNLLLELDGANSMERLQKVYEGLGERDQELARHSLFLGIVMDELNDSPQLGDFLIRNLLGADRARGALVIGEMLREGRTVQFHLRDAETSAQDLDGLLTRYAAEHPIYEETGALLFSCLGRGSYLYGRSDHDTDMFRDKVSAMPLTGFFCNGEIGPVGETTFLHGYTSSFGIFRPNRPYTVRSSSSRTL